jgi:hypothetical protein
MEDHMEDKKLQVDYERTTQYFFHLADTRFKLLGLLPVVTGLALSTLPEKLEPTQGFAVSLLGLIVTIGLTIYDQRNTQMYDRLVKRARRIEKEFRFIPSPVLTKPYGGAFLDRPGRRSLGPIPIIWHDLGLSLVYSASLGAWCFLASWEYDRVIDAGSASGRYALWSGLAGFLLSLIILIALAAMNDRETSRVQEAGKPSSSELPKGQGGTTTA